MNPLVLTVRQQSWIDMIRQQKQSGLTIKSWCEENHISENCFYYRQQKLRESAGSSYPVFAEVKAPGSHREAAHFENFNSTAVITSGRIAVGISDTTSAELIAKIVRALNDQ